jgi:hypothetical protein
VASLGLLSLFSYLNPTEKDYKNSLTYYLLKKSNLNLDQQEYLEVVLMNLV